MKEINLEESQVLQVRNLNLNSQSMWEKPPQINMRPGNGSASGKEPTCQCWKHKKCRTDPWVRKISWRRVWKPLQYSCLENPMDRRAWWATVQGVAKGHDWVINFNQNILKYYCYLKCQFSFVGKNAVCKHFVHFLPCILKLRWSQTFGSGNQLDNFSFHR